MSVLIRLTVRVGHQRPVPFDGDPAADAGLLDEFADPLPGLQDLAARGIVPFGIVRRVR
jgi:hypothetical protein